MEHDVTTDSFCYVKLQCYNLDAAHVTNGRLLYNQQTVHTKRNIKETQRGGKWGRWGGGPEASGSRTDARAHPDPSRLISGRFRQVTCCLHNGGRGKENRKPLLLLRDLTSKLQRNHESLIFGEREQTKKTMTATKQKEATGRDANSPGSRVIRPAAPGNKRRAAPAEARCHGERRSLCFLNCQAAPVDYSRLRPREELISAVGWSHGSPDPARGGGAVAQHRHELGCRRRR